MTSQSETSARDFSTKQQDDTASDSPRSGIGVLGWLRWMWRQLTSMRTALILLFLLAVAAIPGSIVPQRDIDPVKMDQFIADNPGLGNLFEKIGMFNVFSTPWFSAIYLLLCISLIGCIVPRVLVHYRALRSQPPRAPSRFSRMPVSHEWESAETTELDKVAGEIATALRKDRWRVSVATSDEPQRGVSTGTSAASISAEKGYLRETGNLVFHLALLVLLLSVALAGLFGWRGQVLMIVGNSFSNTATQYDSFSAGRLVNMDNLPPFSMTLDKFDVTYQREGDQRGAPRSFDAELAITPEPGSPAEQHKIDVNHPVSVDGAKVYLIGNGYAPEIEVRSPDGTVLYDAPTVFLPTDGNLTSRGVVKMPDTKPQLGLQGIFLPSTTIDEHLGPISTFPAADEPSLFLSAWTGNLGLDNGYAQSVYELDTEGMERVGIRAIRLGESWKLPDNLGTVTFKGVKRFATFDVARDPGQTPALISAIAMLGGLMLSLFIPRRRVWVRLTELDGHTKVEVAGLSRVEESGLEPVVDKVGDTVKQFAPSKEK
ncbi:MAG: cytochrome c biogenesis protein ResB [Candidatus Nanopelagicales bacterium]